MDSTNPVFAGFSSSQTVDKEIILRTPYYSITTLRLLAESNEKYGEYKSLLNTLEFDSKYFLDSVLLNETYKSTQIEGTQISQVKKVIDTK